MARAPMLLAVLALTAGIVGCGHATTVAEPSAAVVSSTARTVPMVDVSAIWAESPLPNCPRWIHNNSADVDDIPGVDMPSHKSVAAALAGVKSPADETWVREELGWVTQHLIKVRKSIRDSSDPAATGEDDSLGFDRYVKHVRAELEAGQNVPDATLDNAYPDGCR